MIILIIFLLSVIGIAAGCVMAAVGEKEKHVYCQKCGEDRPYSKFCPKCGLATSQQPRCGCGTYYNPLRDGGDYCIKCGKQLEITPSPRASDK